MPALNSRLTYGLLVTLSLAPVIALTAQAYYEMTRRAPAAMDDAAALPSETPAERSRVADSEQVIEGLARQPWFGSGEAKPWPASTEGQLKDVLEDWRRLEARVDATQSLLLTDEEVPALADDPETPRHVVDELESIAKELADQPGVAGYALLPLVNERLRLWRAIAASRKTVAEAAAAIDKGDYRAAADFCRRHAALAGPFRQHAAWPAFASDEQQLSKIERQAESASRLSRQFSALADLEVDRRPAALRELLASADPDLPAGGRELLQQAVQELATCCLATGDIDQRLDGAEQALAYFDTPGSRSAVQRLVRRYLVESVKPRPALGANQIDPEWTEAITDRKEKPGSSASKNGKTIVLGIYEPENGRPKVFLWWASRENKLRGIKPTRVRTERMVKGMEDVHRRIYAPPALPFVVRSIGSYNQIAAKTREAVGSAAAWRKMAAECATLDHEANKYREIASEPDGVFPPQCRDVYLHLSFAQEASLAQSVVHRFQTSSLILPNTGQ